MATITRSEDGRYWGDLGDGNGKYEIKDARCFPDAKGRPSIYSMTDSEKIDELLATARALQDLIDSMMGDAMDGKGPAGKVLKMMSAFL